MKIFHVLPVLSVFLLCSCSTGNKKISYTTKKIKMTNRGVDFSASLEADTVTGIVYLNGKIINRSQTPVKMASFRAGLVTDNRYTNRPIQSGNGYKRIAAGDSHSFRLEYKMINDPQLFQRIRFKGWLRQVYFLNPGFILSAEGRPLFTDKIRFEAAKKVYLEYLKKKGGNPELYSLSIDKESFRKKHLAYYKSLPQKGGHAVHHKLSSSMMISGEELMVRQIIFKLVPYWQAGRMKAYLKLVNRSDGIILNIKQLILKTGGKSYIPLNDYFNSQSHPGSSAKGIKIRLQRNGRMYFHIDYGMIKKPDTISISLSGFKDDHKKNVFILPLVFKQADKKG